MTDTTNIPAAVDATDPLVYIAHLPIWLADLSKHLSDYDKTEVADYMSEAREVADGIAAIAKKLAAQVDRLTDLAYQREEEAQTHCDDSGADS